MGQMTMFNVKGVTCGDEQTENYHPSTLYNVLDISAHCFGFKDLIHPRCATLQHQRQTDKIGKCLTG